ncbi:MAG TPA: tRNA lysidine(34) synthetase TilS [Solirubrobacterales bacterium]
MADAAAGAFAELAAAIRESGLVPPGSGGVVLVSGGADSACAAAGLAEVCGAANVTALTVNYGLRETAGEDERVCRELCARLGIELEVARPELGEGNVQAAARDARYAAAERLRALRGGGWIATGHTRTDLAETVLYRLAVSPGRRALLGLPARRGRLIRPLLALERADTRRLAAAAGLPFADDPTNDDPAFARNRIRAEVLPALRALSPAAERNLAETRAELAEEGEVLDRLVAELLESAGAGGEVAAISADALAGAEPALARLALRALAERAARREVAIGRARAAEILRLAAASEGGQVDLGGGLRAICEGGFVSFSAGAADAAPEPAALTIPGECRFGRWLVRAEVRPAPVEPGGPERATLDAAPLGAAVVVRAWSDGDRMRPLGLGGSKSLQDLFTDQRVPRSMRRSLPVVEAAGRVAWVAGVAVSDEFKLTEATREVAVLSARPA